MLFLNRIKELENRLLKELSSILPKYGFSAKYRGQTFYMPKPFGWAAFHLAFIPHREVDFDLTADIALRVDAVQEIVHQDGEAKGRSNSKEKHCQDSCNPLSSRPFRTAIP